MERTVTRIGDRNMMVVAVASGTRRTPALKMPVVKASSRDRENCKAGALLLTIVGRLEPAARAATMVAKKNRAQVT